MISRLLLQKYFIIFQERPPPVPPSRPYTVNGNKKISFPQTRVMSQSFSGRVLKMKFYEKLSCHILMTNYF